MKRNAATVQRRRGGGEPFWARHLLPLLFYFIYLIKQLWSAKPSSLNPLRLPPWIRCYYTSTASRSSFQTKSSRTNTFTVASHPASFRGGWVQLSHNISDIFGIPYLSNVDDPDSSRIVDYTTGIVWERNRRPSCEVAEPGEMDAFSLGYSIPKMYISLSL